MKSKLNEEEFNGLSKALKDLDILILSGLETLQQYNKKVILIWLKCRENLIMFLYLW